MCRSAVAANLLRRNLGRRRLNVVSPRRTIIGTGAHYCVGSASMSHLAAYFVPLLELARGGT